MIVLVIDKNELLSLIHKNDILVIYNFYGLDMV